jgi:hypothetical protein
MGQGKSHSLDRVPATSPVIQHAESRFSVTFQSLIVGRDFQHRFGKRIDVARWKEPAVDAVAAELAGRADHLTSDDR